MISIPTIDVNNSLQKAAALMIEKNSGIIAVLSENKLVGVLTDWDVTAAVAADNRDAILEKIMTKNVIMASPDFSIADIIRELEQYQISAMPVVDKGNVLGMVNSDLIAQRYFLKHLQTR
jgi:CBS domain-containing protein